MAHGIKLGSLPLSFAHYTALTDADAALVGTDDYAGIAYFWAYEYRGYLRDASAAKRRAVHHALVAAGLAPVGESPAHLAIIRRVLKVRR